MNNFPEDIENLRLALRYFMCLFSIWKRIGIGGFQYGRIGLWVEHRLPKIEEG